jgi:hypothetical protein
VYSFYSPDGECEITISATYHLNLPKKLPESVLTVAFEQEDPLNAIRQVNGQQWDGWRQDYANKQKDKFWLAVAARNGTTLVLLSLRGPMDRMQELQDNYEKTIRSLVLGNLTAPQ